MKDIKTRNHVRNIKVINKSAIAAEHMKSAAIRSKEKAADVAQNDVESSTDYGSQQIESTASNTAHDVAYVSTSLPRKAVHQFYQNKTDSDVTKPHSSRQNASAVGRPYPDPGNRPHSNSQMANTIASNRNSSTHVAHNARTNHSFNPTPHDSERHAFRKARTQKAQIKQRAKDPRLVKTKKTAISRSPSQTKTFKYAPRTMKSVQSRAHVSQRTISRTVSRSYARSKQIASASAQIAAKNARKATAVLKKYIRAALAQAKFHAAALSGGGSIAVIFIILLCTIGLILGSSFGILFSGEDTGSGITIRDAIQEINTEYEAQLDSIRATNPHDIVEMTGSRAVWKDVLSVYAVKTTTDPDQPQEVVTVTDEKKELLRNIFWEMNSISSQVSMETRTVTTETADEHGNIATQSQEVQQRVLHINVTHKTVEEMAASYSFNADQNTQLTELLSPEYVSLWNSALYGITASDTAIVDVAISQLGNVNGQPYWSWYGFGSRVEWCACFVSWCANECGYIDNGIIPKYSYCPTGADWFKQRGQWADREVIPEPGMIIFFDWARRGGPDGETDHTGIVEKVENGRVYTIEGNSGNACRERSYPIGWHEIYGYGIPQF